MADWKSIKDIPEDFEGFGWVVTTDGSRMVYTNIDRNTKERRFYQITTLKDPLPRDEVRKFRKWIEHESPAIPKWGKESDVVDESIQVVNQLSKVMFEVSQSIEDLSTLLRMLQKRLELKEEE